MLQNRHFRSIFGTQQLKKDRYHSAIDYNSNGIHLNRTENARFQITSIKMSADFIILYIKMTPCRDCIRKFCVRTLSKQWVHCIALYIKLPFLI